MSGEFAKRAPETIIEESDWDNGDPKVRVEPNGIVLRFTPSYGGAPWVPPLAREEALRVLAEINTRNALINAQRFCEGDNNKSLFLY